MKLWFAKRMKQCPRCESPMVRRASRRGFHEGVVYRLAFVWPYECLACGTLPGISLALLEEIREASFPGESGGCFEIDTPLLTA
jgi:hypothetical protein